MLSPVTSGTVQGAGSGQPARVIGPVSYVRTQFGIAGRNALQQVKLDADLPGRDLWARFQQVADVHGTGLPAAWSRHGRRSAPSRVAGCASVATIPWGRQ